MTPSLRKLRTALAKPLLPVVFFFAGVTYDSITSPVSIVSWTI